MRVRVVLMHNPSAGRENHSAAELIDEIRAAGHEVVAHVGSRAELAPAVRAGCDLVAVAGGDGTVGDAAEVLRGTRTPLTILALGTANNLAHALGLTAPCRAQVATWATAVVRSIDGGRALVDDATLRFLEGLGCGAFPRVIDQTSAGLAPRVPVDRLGRDRRLLAARVAAAPAKRYQVTIDGVDHSGEYLLVEILNIPTLGPRVLLAPGADPTDGALDVVLVAEEHRAALARAIEGQTEVALPTWRATHVAIVGEVRRYHRDGDLRDGPSYAFDVTVERDALRVLVPGG